MNRFMVAVLLVMGGAGAGVGSALITGYVKEMRHAKAVQESAFVGTGAITAPLVYPDGRLSGYVTVEAQLEVPLERHDDIQKQMPQLIDAVNMRTFKAPMATGPDGLTPGIEIYRHLLQDAAIATFGQGAVRRVLVTRILPA